MAATKWHRRPGGRLVRWKKSRADKRPGWLTTQYGRLTASHFSRNLITRRERRLVRHAIFRGEAGAHPYFHPRSKGW
jgi:hypothetical protein